MPAAAGGGQENPLARGQKILRERGGRKFFARSFLESRKIIFPV